jgi:hypothetical protein
MIPPWPKVPSQIVTFLFFKKHHRWVHDPPVNNRRYKGMSHWLHRAESFLANLAAGNWSKKFTAFYRTRRFITAFSRSHHCSLSWARWLPSTPTRFLIRSILILFCQVNLGLLVVPASRFDTRTLYAHLSHTCYVSCPSPWFDNWFEEGYKLWSSSLRGFLRHPITSSPLGRYILLSSLFSNTFSLCSLFNLKDQVSHPHKRTAKIIHIFVSWRVEPLLCNDREMGGYTKPFLGKRLGKHVHRAANRRATMKTVFSTWSVPRGYK